MTVTLPTLLEDFEKALAARPGGISPLTIRSYLGCVRKFARWFEAVNEEPMRLAHVTSVDVGEYKDFMQKTARYKPATMNRYLAALRSFFYWAVEEDLLDESPVRVRNVDEPQIAPGGYWRKNTASSCEQCSATAASAMWPSSRCSGTLGCG